MLPNHTENASPETCPAQEETIGESSNQDSCQAQDADPIPDGSNVDEDDDGDWKTLSEEASQSHYPSNESGRGSSDEEQSSEEEKSESEEHDTDEKSAGNECLRRNAVPDSEKVAQNVPKGCTHYNRFCQIVAPCCGEIFWCRHCHNDVKNVMTLKADCDKLQSRRSKLPDALIDDDEFCSICKFWDNRGIKKKLFHCDGCGICRVGGRENYFHCFTCGSCYPIYLENNHVCVERAMHTACPICLEDMFTSIRPVTVLHCGHTIHQGFQSITSNRAAWQHFDAAIAETPMPSEQRREAYILCNDCQHKCKTPFHFYGCKCQHCGSYNTVEINQSQSTASTSTQP